VEQLKPQSDSVDTIEEIELYEKLSELVHQRQIEEIESLIYDSPAGDMARAIANLPDDQQSRLLRLVSTDAAAFVVNEISHAQSADILEELPLETTAAILDELPSDEQADVLGEMPEDFSREVVEKMTPREARDARLLTRYGRDSAGGLMKTEFIAFDCDTPVEQVTVRIMEHASRYERDYESRYIYALGSHRQLVGVVPIRRLLLNPPGRPLEELMIREPKSVSVDTPLDELEELFDQASFSAAPVIDGRGMMVGVVQRAAVEEAVGTRASGELLKFGGIIGGEELRTMPLGPRLLRRLAFLIPSMALSLGAVMILALFEPIIAKLTALAVFAPMVANLSGASGNQAVAVSIRELALGLVEPRDVWRVIRKEVFLGMGNGLVIGFLIACVVLLINGDIRLAGLLGGAFAINSGFAVSLGGIIPLLLKKIGVDPAMVASPLLATFSDMASFFLVLGLAAAVFGMT